MERFTLSVIFLAACTNTVAPPSIIEESRYMSRPAISADWATNTNYATGPDIGTPTKVVPSAGRFQDGWRNTDVPPAQEQNYWQGLVGDWINWFDSGDVGLASLSSFSPAGAISLSRFFSSSLGFYEFHTGHPFTADGFWVIDNAPSGGQLTYGMLSMFNTKKIPAIGPTPGETYATATPSGRVNPEVVPHGWVSSQVIPPLDTSSVDATILTNTDGEVVYEMTFTGLQAGDVLFFTCPAVARNSVVDNPFQTGTFLSEDNGSSYVAVSPLRSGQNHYYVANVAPVSVELSFIKTLTSPTTVKIQVRLGASSGGTTHLAIGNGYARVERP